MYYKVQIASDTSFQTIVYSKLINDIDDVTNTLDDSFNDVIYEDSFDSITLYYDALNDTYYLQVNYLRNLAYYTTYYWRVKAINEFDGSESAWSSYCTFTTKGLDLTFDVDSDQYVFVDVRDYNDYKGLNTCRLIGTDLNDLRDDVNFPYIGSVPCDFVGNDVVNLSGRFNFSNNQGYL